MAFSFRVRSQRIRLVPYLVLTVVLTGSIWLLYNDSRNVVEQSGAGIIHEGSIFYDSVYQESRYFERKLTEDQLMRSRGLW